MKLEQRLTRLEDSRPKTASDDKGSRARLLAQLKRTFERLPPDAALDEGFLRRASGIELAAIATYGSGPSADLFEERLRDFAALPGVAGKLFSAILEKVDR